MTMPTIHKILASTALCLAAGLHQMAGTDIEKSICPHSPPLSGRE